MVTSRRHVGNLLSDVMHQVLRCHKQTAKKSVRLFQLDRLVVVHHASMKIFVEDAPVTSPP